MKYQKKICNVRYRTYLFIAATAPFMPLPTPALTDETTPLTAWPAPTATAKNDNGDENNNRYDNNSDSDNDNNNYYYYHYYYYVNIEGGRERDRIKMY